jgi:ATP synthase F1 delta subunit
VSDRRRAWARALYEAAPDAAARAAFGAALESLAAAMRSDPELHEFLVDPGVSREQKKALLEAALVSKPDPGPSSGADAIFSRFCGLLAAKHRIALIPQIARSYRAIRDADEKIARLEIESARELSTELVERIARAWAKFSGSKSTVATTKINPVLIAGYRLRSGSLCIDYSIAGRAERLRRELARPLEMSGTSARGEG